MSLIKKVKEIIKEEEKKTLSPMEQLLADPEVKQAARLLAQKMPLSKAREKLNQLLEEEGRLPKTKKGKTVGITYARFKELLPKSGRGRKKKSETKD